MLIDEADRTVSFGEFRDRSERVAAGLGGARRRARHAGGVAVADPHRDDRRCRSRWPRLGAMQNPIIQIYREREVGFALAQSGGEFVLVPGVWRNFDYVAMVERLRRRSGVAAEIVVAYDRLPEGDPLDGDPSDAAGDRRPTATPIRWVYYTSGTTSAPKGAQHTDGDLIAGGIGLALTLEMPTDDVGSIAFPYSHIGGPDYLVMMLAARHAGGAARGVRPRAEAVAIYKRHDVTMAGGSHRVLHRVPQRAAQATRSTPIIPTLRMLSGGGAPKPPEVFSRSRARCDAPGLPRLRHDRVPDDRAGLAQRHRRPADVQRRRAGRAAASCRSSTNDGSPPTRPRSG